MEGMTRRPTMATPTSRQHDVKGTVCIQAPALRATLLLQCGKLAPANTLWNPAWSVLPGTPGKYGNWFSALRITAATSRFKINP